MLKSSVWTRIMLLCAALLAVSHAGATTFFVRSQGNDLADGQTAKTAFHTLLRAARLVNHGDTIVLGPGVYRGSILIAERFGTAANPLAIIGDESGKRTDDPAGPVVVTSTTPGEAALRIYRAQQVQIAGLTFRGSGEGINLERVRGAVIERCSFEGLGKAVTLSECEDARLESTVITHGVMGVVVKNATRTRLAHLTVASCSAAGVMISSSANGQIRNSLLLDNATSLVADNASAPSWSSDYNTICGTLGSWGQVALCRVPYEWASTSGQERHSNYVAPAFVNPTKYDLHPDVAVTWGGGLPGMTVGLSLDPPVKLDRDGKPFTVRTGHVGTGAYDYPEPKPAPGWQKLAVTLPATGVRQSAGIFAKDGTLLRTLVADAVGVRELWWDGRNDVGAPVAADTYEVRSIVHDMRMVDDGTLGDNGNPLGTYNCDNANRIVVYPDNSFVVSTYYDEAGVPLRYYAASGQPIGGSALTDKNIWAMALEGQGKNLIAGVDRVLQRIVFPGERARMPNGAASYPILAVGETLAKGPDGKADCPFGGVAVANGRIYVTVPLAGGPVLRSFDLANGTKVMDTPIPVAGDVDADAVGQVWILADREVIAVTAQGTIAKRYQAGVPGAYLAVGPDQLALISSSKIAFLRLADGTPVRNIGKEHATDTWQPVSGDLYRGLRDGAFMPSGEFIVCESGRVRAFLPQTGQVTLTAISNFMDVAVPHPTKPDYVYCYGATVFHLNHATGAWEMVRESPANNLDYQMGQCITAGTIDGRQYLIVTNTDSHKPTDEEVKQGYQTRTHAIIDITDPVNPRFAGHLRTGTLWAYTNLRIDKDGNIRLLAFQQMRVIVIAYQGRDAQGRLKYPAMTRPLPEGITLLGPGEKDTSYFSMSQQGGIALDPRTNDTYFLAYTPQHGKMVPAWGASGTGIGKMTGDGKTRWFALSSGGNYTGIGAVADAKETYVMAGKDTNGGQIDLFSSEGLRLTTGACGWAANWTTGMVDLRDGLQPYLRPDGKPGAYVEDDNIGRFIRFRVDGADTLTRTVTPLTWAGNGATVGGPPIPHAVDGKTLSNQVRVPRVAPLPVDGDWTKWSAAGIAPQIVSLPVIGWGRTAPQNLLQTFDAGTSIGALAHDGKNLYVYFLTTDNTPHFHADGDGNIMWEFDSIELWIEEEQLGLGFNSAGTPKLFKYRYHNREGREWAANYALPDANIWGAQLDNVGVHPLGQLLGSTLGTPLDGKPGYALMAKIPMEEIKLVGGIAGRKGGEILPMTGAAGETLRIGIAFDGVTAWGREQDFKVYWPTGLMFSDPTTNVPVVLGE